MGKKDDKYFFVDQYLQNLDNNILLKSFVLKNVKKIVLFKKSKKTVVNESDYFKEIVTSIELYKSRNTLNQYKCFIEDMQFLNLDKEITNNDPLASKLVMNLKYIGEDRYNFIDTLNYIENHTKIPMKECKVKFKEIYNRYEKLRAYIIKIAFTKRMINCEKIKEELEIIYTEEEIFNILKQIIKEEKRYD